MVSLLVRQPNLHFLWYTFSCCGLGIIAILLYAMHVCVQAVNSLLLWVPHLHVVVISPELKSGIMLLLSQVIIKVATSLTCMFL